MRLGKGARGALVRWGAFALGAGCVALLLHRVGLRPVLGALGRVGLRIGWLVGIYAASTAVMAFPWRSLMPRAARPTVRGALASRFAASGLNALLPLVGAGEVSRLLWVDRTARTEGAAALVVDRLLFALASALSLAAGAAAMWWLPQLPTIYASASIALAAVLVGAVVAIGWMAARGKTFGLLRRLGHQMRERVQSLRNGASDDHAAADESSGTSFDAALQAQMAASKGRLIRGLAFHVVGRALATLEIYWALRLLGVNVGLAPLLVLAAVPVALSFAGAFVPGQLGLQEGAQAAVAAALGIGASVGLAVVLLMRVRQLLFVPVTALLLMSSRAHGVPSPPLPAPQEE